MVRKILLIICLVFLLTGCDVTYNLTINNDETFDEKVILSFLKQDVSYENVVSYLQDKVPISNNQYEMKSYNTQIYEGNNYYDLVYDYSHDFNNFRNTLFVDSCYNDSKITRTDDKITIRSGKGFRCLNPDNGLITNNVKINITTKLEVLDNNADEVNGNTYTWNINSNNVQNKEVNITLKRKVQSSQININYILFGIIGCVLLVGGLYLFVRYNSKKINDI